MALALAPNQFETRMRTPRTVELDNELQNPCIMLHLACHTRAHEASTSPIPQFSNGMGLGTGQAKSFEQGKEGALG